jgi:hypothetical protein
MIAWRRGGDSNPGHPFGVKLISSQPCSATPAPLREKISWPTCVDCSGLPRISISFSAWRAAVIREGPAKWRLDFPASREAVRSRPNKNFDSRNFQAAPAKHNCESRHLHPAPPAYIEFDSLRPAQIAKHPARDFPAAPANSETIRPAAPPRMTLAPHAIHSKRSQRVLPLRGPRRCAAKASRTTEIPTSRDRQFPAEFPSESRWIAKISAVLAWQTGQTRKDPLRNADRFPLKC